LGAKTVSLENCPTTSKIKVVGQYEKL